MPQIDLILRENTPITEGVLFFKKHAKFNYLQYIK